MIIFDTSSWTIADMKFMRDHYSLDDFQSIFNNIKQNCKNNQSGHEIMRIGLIARILRLLQENNYIELKIYPSCVSDSQISVTYHPTYKLIWLWYLLENNFIELNFGYPIAYKDKYGS